MVRWKLALSFGGPQRDKTCASSKMEYRCTVHVLKRGPHHGWLIHRFRQGTGQLVRRNFTTWLYSRDERQLHSLQRDVICVVLNARVYKPIRNWKFNLFKHDFGWYSFLDTLIKGIFKISSWEISIFYSVFLFFFFRFYFIAFQSDSGIARL